MLPVADKEDGAEKREESRLFSRADFNLLPLKNLAKNHAQFQKDFTNHEYTMLSRPRRRSIDCLLAPGHLVSLASEPPRHQRAALRREVFTNLKNVDKL